MQRTITLEIPGTPVGKGRPKFTMVNGYPMAYTPAATRDYENKVKYCFLNYCEERNEEIMLEGFLGANITAYFPIPKSLSKKKQAAMNLQPHATKPDADNLAKSILDGLSGKMFHDDSQIVSLHVEKYYGTEPKAIVTIWEITDERTDSM